MIEISRLVEVEVAEWYARKFKRPFYVVVGYWREFDVSSIAGDTSLEVKLDTKSISTGNVAVEYSCKGNPSGIEATTADYFVFVIPEKRDLRAYVVDTRDLRCSLKECSLVRGGDNFASLMKLLPLERLKMIVCDTFTISLNLSQLKEYWKR